MEPSEEYPSRSDDSAKQLSIADLKAAREDPESARDSRASLRSQANVPIGHSLVPPHHSKEFVPHFDDPVLDSPPSDWDFGAVVMVGAMAVVIGVVWWCVCLAINVYVPVFAVLTGAALGGWTQRTMGSGRKYGVFGAALTLLVSYTVLIVGIVIRGDFLSMSGSGGAGATLIGAAMVAILTEGPRAASPERLMMIPIACHFVILVGAWLAYWSAGRE